MRFKLSEKTERTSAWILRTNTSDYPDVIRLDTRAKRNGGYKVYVGDKATGYGLNLYFLDEVTAQEYLDKLVAENRVDQNYLFHGGRWKWYGVTEHISVLPCKVNSPLVKVMTEFGPAYVSEKALASRYDRGFHLPELEDDTPNFLPRSFFTVNQDGDEDWYFKN